MMRFHDCRSAGVARNIEVVRQRGRGTEVKQKVALDPWDAPTVVKQNVSVEREVGVYPAIY